uniref:Uncharacterized protein n=1 Tax=Arundo donax TaxID=35708 RepID=A0A0A8ZL16_ARUDO
MLVLRPEASPKRAKMPLVTSISVGVRRMNKTTSSA